MPQTPQHPAVSLVFLLFFLWLMFPGGEYQAQSLILSDLVAQRLARYHDALDVLNQSHWGDFAPPSADALDARPAYLNLTGFREVDGFAWEDLGKFWERGLGLSRYAVPSPRGQQLWDAAQGEPLWANASGTVHGEWARTPGSVARGYDSYNLSRSVPSAEWIGDRIEWARNMTGESGTMLLRIEGNKTVETYEQLAADSSPLSGGQIRNVKATATIEDTSGSGLNWEMRLWGVHWPRQGVILLTTTSEKFEGIFGLPHLTPSADFFQSSQRLLNQSLATVIARKEDNIYIDQSMPWNSDIENPLYSFNPSPHCEYVMYAQVHPPTRQDLGLDSFDPDMENVADVIHAIESELESPIGAPIHGVPELKISSVVYSPDCGFFLESKGPPDISPSEADHLTGVKTEVHIHQVKTWLLVYALVVFGQVFLLKNQMKESFTPSTMGRISFETTSVMVIVDGMTFTAAATWVSSAAGTFLPTLALMFAAFLSMTIGGSFLAKIHEVQIPETRAGRRGRDQPPGGSGSGTASTAPSAPLTPNPTGTGPILPGPVTAGRGPLPTSQPVNVPSDQDVDAEIANAAPTAPDLATARRQLPQPTRAQQFQAVIGRYALFSLCISFLAISSTTWYPSIRSVFLNLCAFVYLSLWVPQIYRNTIRNCRRALRWQFVIGQSVLRLLPIAYFWVKADNFLYAATDQRAFAVLCAWVWLQLFVLGAQEVVGPRFGIPTGWTPEAWDYHPVLREDSLEAGGLPIGLVAEDTPGLERTRSAEDRDKSRTTSLRAIDCAICRETLEVPVLKAGEEATSVASAFARRTYMVTPCRHVFHTACLEGWMRFRLQCPICREELPPL